MIPGRKNQTADFKDAPWLTEAGEITKDKVRIDQSEAILSEITTPSHGDLAGAQDSSAGRACPTVGSGGLRINP